MSTVVFPSETNLVTTAWDDLIVGIDTSNPGAGFVEHQALSIAQTLIDDTSTTATGRTWSVSKIKTYADGLITTLLTSISTFTNKTINADNNTISNLEVDNFKSGVLDTDLTSVSASDDTIPSAKAVKTYVDTTAAAPASTTQAGLIELSTDPEAVTGTDEVRAINPKQLKESKKILMPGTTILGTSSPTADGSGTVYTGTTFGFVKLELSYTNISNGSNTYGSFTASLIVDGVTHLTKSPNPGDSGLLTFIAPVFEGSVVEYSLSSFNNTWNDITFNVKGDDGYIN